MRRPELIERGFAIGGAIVGLITALCMGYSGGYILIAILLGAACSGGMAMDGKTTNESIIRGIVGLVLAPFFVMIAVYGIKLVFGAFSAFRSFASWMGGVGDAIFAIIAIIIVILFLLFMGII